MDRIIKYICLHTWMHTYTDKIKHNSEKTFFKKMDYNGFA